MPDSRLDLFIPISEQEVSEIEDIALYINEAGSTEEVYGIILQDAAQIRTKGVKLMHVLYSLRKNWVRLGMNMDNFEADVYTHTGISPETTRKYVRIWDVVFERAELTEENRRRLYTFPVMALYYLVAPIREEVLTEDDWEEIMESPDRDTVREISQRLLGQQTSSGTRLTLMIDRENGDLLASRGGKEYVFVGYLNLEEDDQVIRDAVDRILTTAHVLDLGG